MTLKQIEQAIIGDSRNKKYTKKGWLPIYSAYKTAKIVIVGQTPGRIAQETNKPWNDASGDNLRAWLSIDRELFFNSKKIALLPMDFYFPGKGKSGDLPPRKGIAAVWHPVLLQAMPSVQLIIVIGRYAQEYYLNTLRKPTLTETVHSYREYLPKFFPLVHPSPRNNIWQAKHPWFKTEVVPALQRTVKKILK